MADNWVDTVAGEFRHWADRRATDDEARAPVDAEGVRLLLDLAREELDLSGPGALTPPLLRELLLEVFPESVVVAADEAPAVVDAVRLLLAFLRDTGAADAASAAALEAELDRLVPEFTEVVAAADTSERQAAAELVTGMMLAEGVPVDDREAVDRWVRDFEALPEEERYARTERYLRDIEERVVPPVRLAPGPELAAAAQAGGLAAEVRALAGWTGDGRAVDEHGELPAADALAAVEALALPVPRRSESVRVQADLPELDRLWWAAVDAEVIVVEDAGAGPGPALPLLEGEGDAEAVLDAWLRVFDGVAVPEHDPEGGLDAVRLVQNELTGVLIHLYEQEEPSAADELAAVLIEHVTEAYESADARELAAAVREALALELDDLVRWGVARSAGEAGAGYALTPLGVWGVRELLLADGFAAPVVGDLAAAPAAELVAGLTWHRQDTADEEIDGWLAGRDAKAAAGDLLEVMGTGGPGARNLAAAVLQRVGPEAADVVREAAERRPVRPYALLWLDRLAEPQDGGERGALDRDDYLWLFVDTVAGMLETADPGEAVAAALADAPAGADLSGMVQEMWRSDHPDAAEVLRALGDHHPDRLIAKAARTAAYKARSVRAPS
ncbi:hypothetical protein [Actinomadura rugatobispora]|uniref:Uncharacterized protein n=1 Tax=Actinomadura rugatobispora TaxID=1994 RepID=A0ABW1ABB6_9ACTN|nr:hypothetical protein GCM10010200_073830 [Actinomadura rugatobispora]